MICRNAYRVPLALVFTGLVSSYGAYADARDVISADMHEIGRQQVQSLSFGLEAEPISRGGVPVLTLDADPLRWTGTVNESAPSVWKNFLTGEGFSRANFSVATSQSIGARPYLSIETRKSIFSEVGVSGDKLSLGMTYDNIEMRYDPKARGGTGSVYTVSIDTSRTRVAGDRTIPVIPFVGEESAAAPGGATSIYARWGSGSSALAGESRAAGYENWMRLDTFDWAGVVPTDSASSGTRGRAALGEIQWTQDFDLSSLLLLRQMMDNATSLTVEYVKDAGAGPVTFMQWVFGSVVISDLQFDFGGADGPRTQGKMTATSFRQTVWEILDDGSRGKAEVLGFDISRSRVVDGPAPVDVVGFGSGNLVAGVSSPPPIPEPETWALMVAGLGLVAGRLARRRSVSQGCIARGSRRA